MDFDLRTLRYATALARHDSFTRAAEALGISQPTLSRAILDLEQSLGGLHFDRGRHGAEATPLGHVLIERAQVLLDEVDQLQNELQQALDPTLGKTVLVAGSVASAVSVGRACSRLIAQHPGLKVRLSTTSDMRGAVQRVLERQADLAVVELSEHDDDPQLEIESLPWHRGAFFCHAGHPLTRLEEPALAEIARFPLAFAQARSAYGSIARRAPGLRGTIDNDTGEYLPALTVDSYDLAEKAAETTDVVTLAPLVDCAEELEDGRLVALPFFESGCNRTTVSSRGEGGRCPRQSSH